jgi:hypothetical protein
MNDATPTGGGDDVMGVLQKISEHRRKSVLKALWITLYLQRLPRHSFTTHNHSAISKSGRPDYSRVPPSRLFLVSCRGLEYLRVLEYQCRTESYLYLEDALKTK